jgi:ATP-dependent Lon protease
MATSIVSALTQTPVRRTTAMAGEVSLRGRVLKVGGLKEKLVAAYRGGVETMIIPEPNQKDLQDVPSRTKRGLEIVPVEHMDEVLTRALLLDEPEAFLERLQQPLLPPEVLRDDRDEIDRVLGREDSSSDNIDQTTPRKLH